MKKIVIALTIICLFGLTGCGKNKMVCTLKESDGEQKSYERKYVLYFDNDNMLETLTWTTSMSLKGNYNTKSNVNAAKAEAEEEGLYYNNLPGMKAEVNTKKNKITLKVVMTMADMDNTDIRSLKIDMPKPDLKSAYEENGYTCK